MLFNSYEFIFLFFPVVLTGFFLIGARSTVAAAGFLALASLFFYGWWSVQALPLLLASIVVNYAFGQALVPAPGRSDGRRKRLLQLALLLNLGLLAVFKYADFFIANANALRGGMGFEAWAPWHLLLPIGISFYTFTQIAFLVDCWRGLVAERSFVHYLLFVTYFPHLIAGPVLHHAQMMPQFAECKTYRLDANKLAAGLAIFSLGLAKKLLIADPLGAYADLVFNAVKDGAVPDLGTAWLGTLAYSFQIYFDFSGYSDMAIGLSLALGITLPINFLSPYQSTSIIEFWRRWHITLSTFLRDYLYIPLGGNRFGEARRYLNLFVTMLLGGLWHGASWTFVLWGAMHGALLALNHLWRRARGVDAPRSRAAAVLGWAATFFAVNLAWVLFRADGLDSALAIYRGLFGLNGVQGSAFAGLQVPYKKSEFFQLLAAAWLICLVAAPAHRLGPALVAPLRDGSVRARGWAALGAVGTVALLGWSISQLGNHSPFLYFQF